MQEGKKEKTFKISYVILSLSLIAFGIAAIFFMIPSLAHGGFMGAIGFVLYIPLMLIIIVMPLWAGFGLLIEQIKIFNKRKS